MGRGEITAAGGVDHRQYRQLVGTGAAMQRRSDGDLAERRAGEQPEPVAQRAENRRAVRFERDRLGGTRRGEPVDDHLPDRGDQHALVGGQAGTARQRYRCPLQPFDPDTRVAHQKVPVSETLRLRPGWV